jgi:glycine/D-amino acid oxidase-like deaminating enzyme
MSIPVDVAILGAGIAGLSVADSCIQKGKTCAIFDISEPGKGTSGAPGMLVNAATGRRAKKAWEAEHGYNHIYSFLHRIKPFSTDSFFEENSVIRPALTGKLAEKFKASLTKYNWPEGWIEWINKDRVDEEYPYIDNEYGALKIKNGLTVNGNFFLKACSNYINSKGVHQIYNQTVEYRFNQKNWLLTDTTGTEIEATYLVDARGYCQTESKEWGFIPFHNIKGQTATFSYSKPLPFSSSISSLGYMAFMKNYPHKVTVGSTYEHDFESLEPDRSGLNYLVKKLENTLPSYSTNYKSIYQWSGVRTTVQDRKPVIGPHPNISNLFIIGALGSKGLLLGRYIAELLVAHIVDKQKIDQTISTHRFDA